MRRGFFWLSVCLGLALAGSLGGAARAADVADETEPPDLSAYEGDTLRTIATRAYAALAELRKQYKAALQELKAAKTENSQLKAAAERVQGDLRKLKEENAQLRAKNAALSAPPPPAPAAATSGMATSAEPSVKSLNPSFKELNDAPSEFLGKPLTLVGFAELTNYRRGEVFEDQSTPRQYIALTDTYGQRIYVLVPAQNNERLFKLLSTRKRVMIKVEGVGVATRGGRAFEAAGQKWETMD